MHRARALRSTVLLSLAVVLAGCATPAPTNDSTSTATPTASAEATPTATVSATPAPTPGACPPPPPGAPPIPPGAPCPTPGMMRPPSPSPSPPSPSPSPSPSPTPTGTGTGTSTGTGTVDGTRAALVQGLWLCTGAGIVVDDYTTSGVGGLTCRVSTRVSGANLIVTASSIPSHDFESGGCCAKEATRNWTIPLAPVNDTDGTLTLAPERGAIAVSVNGAAIYGPEEANGADVVGSNTGIALGPCSAHSSPQGDFHYHADANCVHWHPAAGQTMRNYSFARIDSTVHSGIIGFAFDGYPIYGTYAYGANGAVKEITSSWRLKAGRTGSDASNDYEYVAGLGELDRCNGRFAATPEFPNGTYAYYSTLHNGAGGSGYPYFLACYTGVVASGNIMTGGGGAGGMMPPP